VIQVTEERNSAVDQADRLAVQLQEDPDAFAAVAEAESEDARSAQDGGELGWMIRYQNDAAQDKAIFDLTKPGEVSNPVITGSGIYIYKLLNTSEQRFISQSQRDQVSSSGFTRWLDELRTKAGVWIDSEFDSASTGVAG
jgi:parvulin-like peptidyl-prolyl isomerase